MHDAVVLIFADRLGHELARKGIARRHAALLDLPQLDGVAADVVVSGGAGATFAQRLRSAVASVAHYRRIVVVGRDCPTLNAADVRTALARLEHNDLVLGPDQRGGCWLIGLRGSDVAVLDGIRWCVGEDFAQLRARGAAVAILPVKRDIDHSGDVARATPIHTPGACGGVAQFVAARWQLPPPASA